MTTAELQRGKTLQDEINEQQRVLEHFTRPGKESEKDTIEFLFNFFTKCQNLGSSTLKKDLASLCVQSIIENLQFSISQKKTEFANL